MKNARVAGRRELGEVNEAWNVMRDAWCVVHET